MPGSGDQPLVLVVDDDADVRTSISEVLGRHGYQVLQAKDGFVAREMLGDWPFDVVVLDLHMPGLHGTELLTGLDHGCRVVVYSAFSYMDEDEARRQLGHRVSAFLSKPSPPWLLLAAVESAAEGGAADEHQ